MGEIKVSRSHVEEASRLAIQSSHVSCNLEFLFEALEIFAMADGEATMIQYKSIAILLTTEIISTAMTT